MTARFPYRLLPYIACLAACVLVDLFYFPHGLVLPDERRILGSAIVLVNSGRFLVGADHAFEMPGPALFFAAAVRLFGLPQAIIAIRLAQALLLVGQCALIAYCARRLFDKPLAGFIAACIAAIYPFFLFYQGLLLSETLFDTLLMAGMAALFWWRAHGTRIDGRLVTACLCFAAATMTKASLTILPPLLLGASAWIAGTGWRRALAVLAAAACLYAAFMSPWWIRNALVLHTFVPFTTSSGLNLYLGNNPHNIDGGIDWASDVEPDVFARIQAMPELERQRAFNQAAGDFIKAHPGDVLRLAMKKFVRFWNVVPNASEFRSQLYSLLSAFSFGPVLVLALVCAGRWWRQWRLLAPIYLVIGYFTLLHTVTIASLRYRLPLEPLLIVMASEPLAALAARMRKGAAAPATA
jgi:4-amino-4-deoxy-L-arabinose transferase-like glycosyltransferase